MGLLEAAGVTIHGAGERAFFVPEELGFDEFGRHRGTVQRDERRVLPERTFVNRPCYQFLPGAGLSENAHSRFARCHAVNLRLELFHCRAVADQRVLAEPFLQFAIFGFEARQPQRIFDRDEQLIG